jgi:hypothetical protein
MLTGDGKVELNCAVNSKPLLFRMFTRCQIMFLPACSSKMSTVAEIRAALKTLGVEERAELLAELCGWTDDQWDRQMKADAESGKFDAINNAAAVENQSRKARRLVDLLSE